MYKHCGDQKCWRQFFQLWSMYLTGKQKQNEIELSLDQDYWHLLKEQVREGEITHLTILHGHYVLCLLRQTRVAAHHWTKKLWCEIYSCELCDKKIITSRAFCGIHFLTQLPRLDSFSYHLTVHKRASRYVLCFWSYMCIMKENYNYNDPLLWKIKM
jgi:hypothetical protein